MWVIAIYCQQKGLRLEKLVLSCLLRRKATSSRSKVSFQVGPYSLLNIRSMTSCTGQKIWRQKRRDGQKKKINCWRYVWGHYLVANQILNGVKYHIGSILNLRELSSKLFRIARKDGITTSTHQSRRACGPTRRTISYCSRPSTRILYGHRSRLNWRGPGPSTWSKIASTLYTNSTANGSMRPTKKNWWKGSWICLRREFSKNHLKKKSW